MQVNILTKQMWLTDLYHVCAGLAYYMAMKKAPQRVQEMKLIYEDELHRALQEDGSSSSVYISPKTYYPEI